MYLFCFCCKTEENHKSFDFFICSYIIFEALIIVTSGGPVAMPPPTSWQFTCLNAVSIAVNGLSYVPGSSAFGAQVISCLQSNSRQKFLD